jgi:hypothetical protein
MSNVGSAVMSERMETMGMTCKKCIVRRDEIDEYEWRGKTDEGILGICEKLYSFNIFKRALEPKFRPTSA